VRVYVRTLLDAVGYMHERNCVHRDLKPENVLLSDMSDSAIIKIVDLGLSRFVDGRKLMRTVCGTHKYLAPEMVQTDNGQLQGYDKAIDMWGVGLLTFIMLCGFNPFARESHQDTHTAIVQAQWAFPDGYTVSDAARSFVRSVLQGKAEHRLTAGQATQHPWLSSPPASPSQLLTREREPVQDKLSEFNAHRMLDKVVKSAHRRLTGAASSNTTDTM
jgi:calcium/calmodulin-dependent protein kinase I